MSKKSIKIIEKKTQTSSHYVYAFVDDDGSVGLSVQDLYNDDEGHFGNDEVESFIYINKEYKDDLILALLKKHYEKKPTPDLEFMNLMKENNIPCFRSLR